MSEIIITENGVFDGEGNQAIFNWGILPSHQWSWISPDDLFVRYLTDREINAMIEWELKYG